MADTPAGSMPVVGESTVIRFKLGALIAIALFSGSGLIGGTLWASNVINRLDSLSKRMERIEKALGIESFALAPIFGPPVQP